jgi:hypothetical protein
MKTLNTKQLGFFDPVTGLVLLLIFGITGVAITSAKTDQPQQETVSIETAKTVTTSQAGHEFNQLVATK